MEVGVMWDSLKKGLIEHGVLEDDSNTPATKKTSAKPMLSVAPASSTIHASGAINVTSDIDQHFVAALKDAASKSTIAGFSEFLEQIEAIKDDVPDEGTRIRLAAKAAARAHKIQPQQIAESLQDRLRLLDQEYKETEQGFAAQADSQAANKQSAITALESQIKLKQQELATFQNQRQAAETELLSLKQKITTAKTKFEAAYEVVKTEYEGILSKLKASLK